jgi:ribonuclease BN (tRNA processing enzyme)
MDQSVVSTEDAVTISKGSLNFPFPLLEFAQSLIAAKGAEDAGMGKHGVSLKSFVETTTREEALLREVAKDKESLCSSVPITVTSMTSINSPHLTNLTASFQAETSIQKPSKQQDEDPQSDKWESIGNYDAAQALRERLSHSKRKHSQGNNMVVDTVLFRGDDEPKHSSSSQPSEIGNQRLEPLHKRMQRKPSCEVANNFSWSPTANTARFGGNEGDHRLGLSVAPAPEIQNDLFQIYFLGTGCATPSKHRNNSCIMISLQASGVIPPLPPLFEDVPLLSLPVPSLMLPPPPILTIPHSTVLSSSSASLSIPTQLNSSEVDNPFASKSTKPSLSLDLNLDQGKRSNPFASVNKNSSKPSLALDLGLCGLEPAKPASRRPSATLSLDLSLCNSSAGPSGTSTPYNCDISTTVVNDDNSKPIILFDVGEGTASQLFQLVNGDAERFDDYLLRIRVIWISHHHADHTTGLPMLLEHVYRAQLRRRRKLLSPSHKGDSSEDLSPAAPPSLPSLMTKYDMRRNRHGTPSPGYEANKIMIIASEQLLQFYEYAATAAGLEELVTFNPISTSLYAGLTREMRFATNGAVKRLQSVPVQHCQNAYGVVLELADGQKIVFSGDCRPSQSLVKCGLNCDILIHEATFTDDRLEHAMKKRHSTFSEAVDIGRRMSAKHVILTHFSQRYPMTLQTSSPACTTNVMAQTSDSESVPSNPPSVGSSGNMFSNSNSNSVSNQGLRRGSKTNIFSTLSPPKLVSMKSTSSILTDAEGSSLDERVLSSGEEKSFYSNVSIAYDFLQISFPSQIDTLPQATALVANTFSAMEEIEACDDDKE